MRERLDPLHPPLWDFYIGRALLHVGQLREALHMARNVCAAGADLWHWQRYMAAALAHLGRVEEARAGLTGPGSNAGLCVDQRDSPFNSYMDSIEFDRLIEGLRKAGLPE